ncbi:polyhydroxyalkanoic synthase [Legionella londiniensis]|uniref:Polyhydroxyalkanoic synthase n=1 Tax=Legionella londiniensis TaxID=45068 RepID=A0A0W0VNC3_9GAMM|nr:polyhydroxyalkanoic synthase [Legionella londiniensis]STX93267.1 polyhydroxyalkanoic synthase [Legionella londiniensis]
MNGLEKQCCPKEILLTQQQEWSQDVDACCYIPAEISASISFFPFFTQLVQASLAKWTAGISPAALGSSYSNWLWQLAQTPGLLWELATYPVFHAHDCINNIVCIERAAGGKDVRFKKDSWQPMPWRLFAEGFLQVEDWWRPATTSLPGLLGQAERTVSFWARQCLNALSPSNFVWSNPDLFHEALRTGGLNLIQGSQNECAHEEALRFIWDWIETWSGHWQVISVAYRIVHGGALYKRVMIPRLNLH